MPIVHGSNGRFVGSGGSKASYRAAGIIGRKKRAQVAQAIRDIRADRTLVGWGRARTRAVAIGGTKFTRNHFAQERRYLSGQGR